MLESYKKALLGSPKDCQQKEDCFRAGTACKGVGNSRFELVEKNTQKSPTHIYCIDMDCVWPNPPQGQAKCDYVFIQLPIQGPIPREAHFYFVELKKATNFNKAIGQIIQTIDDFKHRFRNCTETPDLPNKQITGIIAGGASPKSSDIFQKVVADFKKKYGCQLVKASKYEI